MKSFQIQGFSWSVFSRIWTQYFVSLRIQSNCGKNGPEKTSYLDIFHAVKTMYQFELIWGHSRWNNRFQKQSSVDTSL